MNKIYKKKIRQSPLGAVGRKGLRGRKKALSGSPITFLKQNRKYSVVTGFQMQIKNELAMTDREERQSL